MCLWSAGCPIHRALCDGWDYGYRIPRASVSRGSSGVDFEDGAFDLLQGGEHLEEVACLRVSLRAEHPHQALGRLRQRAPGCPIPRASVSRDEPPPARAASF